MPALLRSAMLALAVGAVTLPASVQACAVMSKEGEARRAREQAQWLREETDLKVRGTFAKEPQQVEDVEYEELGTSGIITATNGRRYRVWLPVVINCGFPNYSVSDGEAGLFYLKREEDPFETEEEDLADGVIDNYRYIHFRSGRGK